MKRLLILTGIAVLAVTSCARDEIKVVNKGHAIDFKVVETKGDVKQYAYDVDHFYVTAFEVDEEANTAVPYFTDVSFGRLGEYFTSSPAYYWPADGSMLMFIAYTPGAEEIDADVTIGLDAMKITGFSPKTNITEQVDLMTAGGYGNKDNEATGVHLTFRHNLARIQVHAQEQNAEHTYSISGVRLVNFASKGDMEIMTQKWTLEDEKSTYILDYENDPISVYSYNTNLMFNDVNGRDYNDALVLPQTFEAWDPVGDPENNAKGAYVAVRLQIKAQTGDQVFPENEGEYGWAAIPVPDIEILAGTTYYFYLNLTNGAGYTDPEDGPAEKILGDDIMFTVKVNEAEEPTAGAAIRKDLEGHWKARAVWNHYIFPEDWTDYKYQDYGYDTPEDVIDYFNNNGFYEFDVDNNYNLTMTTPSGITAETSFTVDDEGNVYLEALKDSDGGWTEIPKVYEINTEEKTCTILVEIVYDSGYTRQQYIYYDRS